ncbi:MAG: hypothetical protein FJW20_22150 [Acidimicrobiia bacterium]|nr:hypothetical protein [Acidimicrobiia bacterium]
MNRRSLLAAAAFALIAAGVLIRTATSTPQITNPQPAPPASDLQAVTLIFGSKDPAPAKWDGSATITAGRIERIVGHHFNENAKILPANAWECSTTAWGQFSGGMHPNEKPQPQPAPVEATGVTIYFRAPADASLRVKVPRGEFAFRPMDIPETEGIFPLNAMVEVYRTPVVEKITSEEQEDDYPSIAVDAGRVWVAWQSFRNNAEQVFLRSRSNGAWAETLTVTEKPGDLFGTAVAASGGTTMVVWSEHIGDDWHLKARIHDGTALGAVQNLTSGKGNNLFHQVAAVGRGNFHVVWQSWRGGRSDIYLRSFTAGKWTSEMNLSDPKRHPRANDWSPAVAVARNGTVYVAWDGYATGNYNVYMREVKNNAPGPLIQVTNSTRFHAHPSLAVDAQDRVWVAWDEGPENWGKDTGFLLTGGTGIYHARTVRVAVYAAGLWQAPLRQPDDVVPYGFKRYFHTPRLAADSAGRIWLFARPRTSSRLPTSLWAAGGKWEVTATYYHGDRWSDLFLIPESIGRNEGELRIAPSSDGHVYAAWVTDQRLWGGPNFGHPPRNNEIMVTRLRAAAAATPALAPRPPDPPGGLASEPKEREQLAAIRSHVITSSGKTYRIYRGDMHRHTDISLDGAGDGSLWDAYRYAMDAANMDYFLVTDHQSGEQPYTWWRIDKSGDMFHVPGFFTAMFGTERSLGYPNGHRNLVFARRGVPLLEITAEERKSDTGPRLYPYLRKYKGIATSHTSHTNMGTDWRDNDPDLEPVVEIFQGARTSAEHEGAPLSPTEIRTELHAGGYRPLGFVWKAWEKGYKLGTQASSDHVSTHTSYSCVIAENPSRETLLEALRKRHSYGATSNIVLDYRLRAGTIEALQGDVVKIGALPELTATITATAPLKKVVVVRDNQYIFSAEPNGETYTLRYRENQLTPGEHYYYVRVEQQDGNMAWSSPVWVTYSQD